MLTTPQYVIIAVVAVLLLYKFDMLPEMINGPLNSYLPNMIKNIIKPQPQIAVPVVIPDAAATAPAKLPEGVKCDSLDEKQCGMYPAACMFKDNKCIAAIAAASPAPVM
jgi:hypothetical protein